MVMYKKDQLQADQNKSLSMQNNYQQNIENSIKQKYKGAYMQKTLKGEQLDSEASKNMNKIENEASNLKKLEQMCSQKQGIQKINVSQFDNLLTNREEKFSNGVPANKRRFTSSSIKRFSALIDKEAKISLDRRFSSASINPVCNQFFTRKTCKMFDLDFNSGPLQPNCNINNIIIKFHESKFSQVKELDMNLNSNQVSYRVQSNLSKSKIEVQNHKIKEDVSQNKIQFKKPTKNLIKNRKSRFSINYKNKQKLIEKESIKIIKGQKDIKEKKFHGVKNVTKLENEKLLLGWKKWKMLQSNNHLNLARQEIEKKLKTKHLHRQLHDYKLIQMQRQLREIERSQKKMKKLTRNQELIEYIREQNRQKVNEFFEDFEDQISQYTVSIL